MFGKDGQLGKAFQDKLLQPLYQRHHNIHFVGRNKCDLSNPDQIIGLLNRFLPDLIINGAAYTAVDQAESEPELAFAINASAPEVMAKYCAQQGASFLHFSTDYVFSGDKQSAYTELDQPSPLSVYGKSKAAGEKAIIKAFDDIKNTNSRYVIFRTSWVYGAGNNFIRTISRLASQRTSLQVIKDQYGVPTSADWLAQVACCLALGESGFNEFRSGIYNAVPQGETSWYALACLVVKAALDAGKALKISPAEIVAIPASEYSMLASRPMNSRLSRDKLKNELERLGVVSKLPHWNTPWDKQVLSYVKHL